MRKTAVLAAGLCAVAGVAEAQDGGFYFGAYGFGGMTQEFETSRRGVQGTFNLNPPFTADPPVNDPDIPTDIQDTLNTLLGNLTYADDFIGGYYENEGTVAPAWLSGFGATLGYATGNGLRFEFEASRFTGATSTAYTSSNLIILADDPGTDWEWSTFGPLPGSGGYDGTLAANFFLANMWVGMVNGPIVPYFGGGGGLANVTQTEFFGDDAVGFSATGFGFQAGAGVLVNLGNTVSLDFGYRFKGAMGVGGTTEFQSTETTVDEFNFNFFTFEAADRIGIHTFSLGLIFNF